MSFGQAIRSGFSNGLKFRGVASRSEYWWFALFSLIVGVVTSVIDTAFGLDNILGGVVGTIASLVLLIPRLSLLVRRFRDTGVSPLWLISALVPLSGFVSWLSNNLERFQQVFQNYENPSDAQITALARQLSEDPVFIDSLMQLLAILLLALLYSVFELVVTLLPTKRPK
jgi:uncharacterized membrane protein YhaH (DUF805 family)